MENLFKFVVRSRRLTEDVVTRGQNEHIQYWWHKIVDLNSDDRTVFSSLSLKSGL